ncbi:MAG: hypothetical protein RL623_1440 [Actinomycetota bacterium]|jgi:hypothetical protein
MMKRLFWFVLGAFAGVFGVRYAKNKARAAAEQLTPGQIAADVLEGAVKLVQQGVEIVRNLRQNEEVIHFESESVTVTQNQN